MPRLAFSEPSIGSTTTCVGPPAPNSRSPSSSEMSVKSPPTLSSRRTIASSAAASIATVSSPPLPAPTTGSRSTRLGSSTSTACTSSTAARQVAAQSVVKRLEQQARGQLRKEVRRLLRHHLAVARAREHVLDFGWPQEERRLGFAAVDSRDGLVALRRVGDALGSECVDDLDVQSIALEQLVAAAAIQNDSGQLVSRLVDRRSPNAVDRLDEPVRRKDGQPFLSRRDQHDHHPSRRLVAVLLVAGQPRRLPASAAGCHTPPARQA